MFFVLYLDLFSGLCRAIFPVYLVYPFRLASLSIHACIAFWSVLRMLIFSMSFIMFCIHKHSLIVFILKLRLACITLEIL